MLSKKFIEEIHKNADDKCYIGITRDWYDHIDKYTVDLIDEHKIYDRMYKIDEFKTKLNTFANNGEEDVYFTINNYYKPKKISSNVRQLNCFALDFDFYKINEYKNLSPTKFYNEILKNKLDLKPNVVIDSGRGVYIIYLFNNSCYKVSKLYKAIYKSFYEKYKEFGMDPAATNITQIIRCPGTLNTKCMRYVNIIYDNYNRYNLLDIAKIILKYNIDEVIQYKKTKEKNLLPFKINSNGSKVKKDRAERLINDLSTIIKLRNDRGIIEGYRELLIYIAREHLEAANVAEHDIIAKIIALNQKFLKPLSDSELLKTTKPSKNRRVSKIETVIDKLGIDNEERKYLNYIALKKEKDLNTKKKRIRNRLTGITNKQIEITKRRSEVITLKRKGLYNVEIARKLNIDKSTVTRDLKYIDKNRSNFIYKLKEYIDQINDVLCDNKKKRQFTYMSIKSLEKGVNDCMEAMLLMDG